MKILYAANNNVSSLIQLERFLQHIDNRHQLKIAAYKKSSPPINIDWQLDCLLNLYRPELVSLENENFEFYFNQIKKYNPDLIISDLEYFTSHIANSLNIPLWNCSSSLINFAVPKVNKHKLNLFKNYSYLFENNPIYNERMINIITNADKNFVYSHLGDEGLIDLKEGFEWIRPFHKIGKKSNLCKHSFVAGSFMNDKKIISFMKRFQDNVFFSNYQEYYSENIMMKNINNTDEYYCNLHNSNLFICNGHLSFLADSYYNNKFCLIFPDLSNVDTITNSAYSDYLQLSQSIFDVSTNIEHLLDKTVNSCYNPDIKYLHEKIAEI